MRRQRFALGDSSRRDEPFDLELRFVTAFLDADIGCAPRRRIPVNPRQPAAGRQSGFEKPIMNRLRTTPAPEPPQFSGGHHCNTSRTIFDSNADPLVPGTPPRIFAQPFAFMKSARRFGDALSIFRANRSRPAFAPTASVVEGQICRRSRLWPGPRCDVSALRPKTSPAKYPCTTPAERRLRNAIRNAA